MMKRRYILLLALCTALAPLPAAAQSDEYVPPGTNGIPPGNTAAGIDVQLSNIQDQLRQLRGEIEENQFQVKKLTDDLAKLQRDTDFRFNELTSKPPSPAAETKASPAEQTPPAPDEETTMMKKHESSEPTTAGSGVLTPPGKGTADNKVTPRQQYTYAYQLLSHAKYSEAAAAFAAFTKHYPKDPLVGNAYYWEGETYYIRKDYVKAADNFRKGFEALPDGPKAADNLLKLAMSLDALKRDKDACVVLKQIVTKYRKYSVKVTEKAGEEQKQIGCK